MNLLYEHQIQKVARQTWRYRSKWLHSSLNGFYTMLYVQSCVYNGYRNFQFSYLDKTKLPGRQKTYPWNLITNTALSFKIANKNNLIIKHNYKKNKYISATKDNQYQHACYTRIKNGFKCKDISEKNRTASLYKPVVYSSQHSSKPQLTEHELCLLLIFHWLTQLYHWP